MKFYKVTMLIQIGANQTAYWVQYEVKSALFKWVWFLGKFYHANGNFRTQEHYWELSNEMLYAKILQGASKLPGVRDLDLCNLLNKRGLFWNF